MASKPPLPQGIDPGRFRGWLLYDADCSLCTVSVRWTRRLLLRHGFAVAPLQDPWVAQRLNMTPQELLREVRLLMSDATLIGGVDVILSLARPIWWAWPAWAIGQLPGIHWLLQKAYYWVSDHRHWLSHVLGLSATQCGRPDDSNSNPPQ